MTSKYRMPAEWNTHAATWIAWPHQLSDWPGKFQPIPWVYAEIVRALTRVETVHIAVKDATHEKAAHRILHKAGAILDNVVFHRWPTDRVWTRDSGPTFVFGPNGERALLDWHFNAWAKYDNWKYDDQLPARIAEVTGLPIEQPMHKGRRVVLEGGSIEVNGEGLLLTTEECLLSDIQCRNPGFGREDYEAIFSKYLGIEKVLWLGHGIVGDDTHGHIDDLARFVDPHTIVTVVESDPGEANYRLLQDNLERLQGMTDTQGKALKIVPLPMPAPLVFNGHRLPASYANFYIANRTVLVPTFNDPNDRIALNRIAELMPQHVVIGIHCVDLVFGLGTLHCMTQQEPLGR